MRLSGTDDWSEAMLKLCNDYLRLTSKNDNEELQRKKGGSHFVFKARSVGALMAVRWLLCCCSMRGLLMLQQRPR